MSKSYARQNPYLPGKSSELAKAVTILLNPLWMQVYWLVGSLSLVKASLFAELYIVVALGIIPTIAYLLYARNLKLQNTYDLPKQYRYLPFLFNFLGLGLLVPLYVYWPNELVTEQGIQLFGSAVALEKVFTATWYLLAVAVVALVVTTQYKISLHMMGYASAAAPLLYWYWQDQPTVVFMAYELFQFGAGALVVAWSRTRLKAHTQQELMWGTIVGTALPIVYFGVLKFL